MRTIVYACAPLVLLAGLAGCAGSGGGAAGAGAAGSGSATSDSAAGSTYNNAYNSAFDSAGADASAPGLSGGTGSMMPVAMRGGCDAEGLQGSLGQMMSDSLARQLSSDAGASVTRTLHPGQVVTMEYNPQRLNVLVDERKAITAIRCG